MDVFDIGDSEWLAVGAEPGSSFQRFDIAEDVRSAVVQLPLVRLVGGASGALVGDVDALDPPLDEPSNNVGKYGLRQPQAKRKKPTNCHLAKSL